VIICPLCFSSRKLGNTPSLLMLCQERLKTPVRIRCESFPGERDASSPGERDASSPGERDASSPGKRDASSPGKRDASSREGEGR
jgi:hypothetical protein